MKKLCLLVLVLTLFGCETNNVKKIEHNTRYSSELIGTIDYTNAYDNWIDSYENIDYCLKISKQNSNKEFYEIDTENKQINKLDYQEVVNDSQYYTWYINEKNKYSILHKTEHEIVNNETKWIETYYYKDDNKFVELYRYDDIYSDEKIKKLKTISNEKTFDYYFCIKDDTRNLISIKKVDNGQLIEIDTIPLIVDNYSLADYYLNENGFILQYENEQYIKVINNNKEQLYNKVIDDYTLIYASLIHENVLYYENDKYIKYLVDGQELRFDKQIDGYIYSYYIYKNNEYRLFYQKDNAMKIVIDNKVFDIKDNTQCFINKDYILYTYKDENREFHTMFIDFKEKQEYELSETFDLYDVNYKNNHYLIKKYGEKGTSSYNVLIIKDDNISLVELPFDYYVEFKGFVNDNQLVFTNKNENKLDVYLVTIEE